MSRPDPVGAVSVLIDTNVLSYWIRDDSRGVAYRDVYTGTGGQVAFQTVAELYRWSYEKRWSERRIEHLREFLSGFTAIDFTWSMAQRWARIVADRNLAGRPISTADAWIAATAVELRVPLMTHNRRDFEGIADLEIISFG